ncbi:hypothetical protein OEA41_005352 [Lepraria neglecta]|uniref:Uncharacterized protein n=1 Tax=Lepraria neglecta TaxID=209136 RepID=A0AAD9YZM7_9LECA|nr:hypothetical protein OEA41_005352 [Lepraria neglecta]
MPSLPPLPSVSRSETTNPSVGTSKDSSSSNALRSSLSLKLDALERGHMLNPLIVFDSLLSTLKKNEISGPTLLRLESELSQGLGTETESQVLGVNLDFLTLCRYDREKKIRSVVREFPKIAIKRARPQVHAEAL